MEPEPLQNLNEHSWVPKFHRESTDPQTKQVLRHPIPLKDYATWECPKSLLRDGQAYELVRKYHQAKSGKTTLSKLMRSQSPFLEDVEVFLRSLESEAESVRMKAQYES